MYTVYKSPSFGNPLECEVWLNKLKSEEGLELVSTDGGYYIFTSLPEFRTNKHIEQQIAAWVSRWSLNKDREVGELLDFLHTVLKT